MRDSTNEVLRAIATNGPISRAQLARDLGLSGPTLTQATKILIKSGLVKELQQTPSTGGRPATQLGLAAAAGQIIGVKLAPDHVTGVCVNLDSEILWSFDEPFEAQGNAAIKELTLLLKKQAKKVKGQLIGIGVGLPGVVAPGDEGITDSVIFDWKGINVGEQLSLALEVPVLLENDVNTLSITESLYGRGRDISNFLTITLGRGIGLGIVINGELYNGSHGAGEFGHVNAVKNGEMCECGKKGCLETIAGDPAILSKAIALGLVPKNSSIEKVRVAARGNKQISAKIFKEPAEAFGIAIANLINILGPELLLISGEGSEGWDLWKPWVEAALQSHVVETMKDFEIEIDPWDDRKWALGATAIVIQASFSRSGAVGKNPQDIKKRLQVVNRNH